MSRRGWLLFCSMAVVWGIPYLLIRVAVRELDPGVVVFLRTAPASLLLTPLVARRGQFHLVWSNFLWIALFGVVEFGVPWYFMSTVEVHLTSSLTSLLICAIPLFSIAAARFTRTNDRITRRRLGGLVLGALGVGLLVGLDLSGGSLKWIAMMLFVCVGYTAGPIILNTRLAHVPGPAVVCGATGLVAVLWLPYTAWHLPTHVSGETWLCVVLLSVVCTTVAFLTFFELIKETSPSRAVVVVYSNTAIAVLLGIVGLHEPLTAGIVLGFPLIVLGSYYATSSGRLERGAEASADANLVINE